MRIRIWFAALISVLVASTALASPTDDPVDPYEAAGLYSAQNQGTSLVIFKDGVLVHESYPNFGSRKRGYNLASGTKSFSAVIAAAAVQDGLLSLDERVSETLPEWADGTRDAITLRDLLTLTSGIKTQAPFKGPAPSYAQAIEAKAVSPRGEVFAYGPAPFQVFGEVMRLKLRARYGNQYRDASDYLSDRVFSPLNIRPTRWARDAGFARMPSGAWMTARDWAEFGLFALADGAHDGVQLVDRETLIATHEKGTNANPAYGAAWWLFDPQWQSIPQGVGVKTNATDLYLSHDAKQILPKFYMAAGASNQRLYIVPSLNMVIVRQQRITRKGMRSQDGFSDIEFLLKVFTVVTSDEIPE